MTICLLIRHATTDHVGHVLSGRAPGVHLNAVGVHQAELLAQRLRPLPLAAVYTSPLERARETAAKIAAPQRLEARVVDAAGEVDFGEWTGRGFLELAQDAAWQRWNRMRSVARVPGGESALEVQARVVTLLERMRLDHPDACVALVSHADVIKLALALALGTPIDLMHRIEVQPASISTLAFDGAQVRVLGLNDTSAVPLPV